MSKAKNSLKKPVELTPPSDMMQSKEESSPGKCIVYSRFKGQEFIYVHEVGNMRGLDYLMRKGISLIPNGLNTLRERIIPIDNLLAQREMDVSYGVTVGEDPLYKEHLGATPFATIISTFPTENGIHIPVAQWSAFNTELNKLYTAHNELNKAVECCMSHGDNQMEFSTVTSVGHSDMM